MSEIHVVNEDATQRIAAELDEQSTLKDGYTVMALFELEQAVFSLDAKTPQEVHLRESSYQAFEYIVRKIYGGEDYAERYTADIKLFANLIKNQSMQ